MNERGFGVLRMSYEWVWVWGVENVVPNGMIKVMIIHERNICFRIKMHRVPRR